jgi:hypothetical protein
VCVGVCVCGGGGGCGLAGGDGFDVNSLQRRGGEGKAGAIMRLMQMDDFCLTF